MRAMLRFCLGFALVTSIVVSCGDDDEKRKVRGDEAGAGGEAGGALLPDAGGSSFGSAGEAGASAQVGGASGAPASHVAGEGGVPAGAGTSAGGALGGGAGEGTAGAGGDSGGPVSLFCEPGQYNAGEPGCLACEGEPEPQTVNCIDAFWAKDVLADGGPIAIQLSPNEPPREPLPVDVDVTYQLADSVEVLHTQMTFNFTSSYWEIDVNDVPESATQMRVQPFSVPAVCGDTFTLTDEVIFVTGGGDSWAPTCPGQT